MSRLTQEKNYLKWTVRTESYVITYIAIGRNFQLIEDIPS